MEHRQRPPALDVRVVPAERQSPGSARSSCETQPPSPALSPRRQSENSVHLAAVLHTRQHIGKFGIGDLTVGLRMLTKHESAEKAEADAKLAARAGPGPGALADTLDELAHYVRFAKATYRSTDAERARTSRTALSHLLESTFESAAAMPAYFVARCDRRGEVVLAVRGTRSVADALTNADATTAPFEAGGASGLAHAGLVESTNAFLADGGVLDRVFAWVEEFGASRLVLVGHSLGAGAAGLLAMRLAGDTRLGDAEVRAFCFAPPAAVCAELRGPGGAAAGVTSVLLGDDPVPRASLRSFEDLRARLDAFKWRRRAAEQLTSETVVRGAAEAVEAVKRAARALVSSSAAGRGMLERSERREAEREAEHQRRIAGLVYLYPPGRVLHLARDPAAGAADGAADDYGAGLRGLRVLERSESAGTIVLGPTAVRDHRMDSYMEAIARTRAEARGQAARDGSKRE